MSQVVALPRKSSRMSAPTDKRKAAGWSKSSSYCTPWNADHITDEGSEEQMKKRMKSLEDQIKKLTDTNTALTDNIRTFQKEKVNARHNTDNDKTLSADENGDDDSGGDSEGNGNDSPMLFKARKVYKLRPLLL